MAPKQIVDMWQGNLLCHTVRLNTGMHTEREMVHKSLTMVYKKVIMLDYYVLKTMLPLGLSTSL